MRVRAKQSKPQQFEKILTVMLNGKAITKEEIEKTVPGIETYRMSTYMWNMKMAGAVVKTLKDGRKVSGYQLMNVDEMQKYIDKRNKDFANAAQPKVKVPKTPNVAKSAKVKKVSKLKDLNADPIVENPVDDGGEEMTITGGKSSLLSFIKKLSNRIGWGRERHTMVCALLLNNSRLTERCSVVPLI